MIKLTALFICTIICSCCSKHESVSTPAIDLCASMQKPDSTGIAEKLGLSGDKMKTHTGMYSLEDGGESLVIRAWLCQQALKTIDIQYYIFTRDNSGLVASDFLIRAADRGVKIRLIIDDATAKAGQHEIYALDSHENIVIKIYNPGVKLGSVGTRIKKVFTEFNRLHRRMHVKTFTIDNEASIIGGRNIADEYFDYDGEYNFRDRDVLMLGKTVHNVTKSFEHYWNHPLSVPYTELVKKNKKKLTDPRRFDRLHQYACDEKNFSARMREKIKNFPDTFKVIQKSGQFIWLDQVSYVVDDPGKNENRKDQMGGICTDSLIALIKQAKTSIDIQSPYLITTEIGKALFSELVKRGVKIRILTNSLGATDNHEAFSGYQRDRAKTLETGIEIYEFKPDAAVRYKVMTSEVQSAISYTPVFGLHSKTMIIDNYITVIGSFNLDPRSANLNMECVAIFRSKEVAKNLAKHLNEEFLPENAWRITKDFNPDSEASTRKRIKTASRKIIPKKIL